MDGKVSLKSGGKGGPVIEKPARRGRSLALEPALAPVRGGLCTRAPCSTGSYAHSRLTFAEMPVVRSDDFTSELDAIDDARFGYRPPERLDVDAGAQSNATGVHLELEVETLATDSWREKAGIDESEYTRLRLDEDEESEEVHMRTRYLFNEDKAMTPLSQMQATKELLTEGQRIAYVGLCALIARRMLKDMGRGWEGKKIKQIKGKGRATDLPVVESANIWIIKIMARLFQHMDLDRDGEYTRGRALIGRAANDRFSCRARSRSGRSCARFDDDTYS